MNIDLILLIIVTLAALWTVMARSLLKAAISLAITSVAISVVIFRLNSPLAAVFELSVCAGLITAIFVSTISMVKPLSIKELAARSKSRFKRYAYLPILMIAAGVCLILLKVKQDFIMIPPPLVPMDVRTVLWNSRGLDLLGQVIILIAGALGIVILFAGDKRNE